MELTILTPFDQVVEENLSIIRQADALEITNADTAETASNLAALLHDAGKVLDAKRKEMVKPYDDESNRINAHCKPHIEGVKEIKKRLEGLLKVWQDAERARILAEQAAERERIEAEARAREEEIARREAERQAEIQRLEAERQSELERLEAQRQAEIEWARKHAELNGEAPPPEPEPIALPEIAPLAPVVLPPPIVATMPAYEPPPKLANVRKVARLRVLDIRKIDPQFIEVKEQMLIRFLTNGGTSEGAEIYYEETTVSKGFAGRK